MNTSVQSRLIPAALLYVTLILNGNYGWTQTRPPQTVPPPSDIKFVTRLDQTAVWVGDQFHYLVMVEYPQNYEFVLDNLTRETVNMDPFQVMEVGTNLVAQKEGRQKLFVDLTLANFGTGRESIQVPQFTLYYFRKDKSVAGVDQAEAESLTIPGPVIGTRSTLPPQPTDIRDAVTLNSWDRIRWALPTVAWVCLGVLVIGFGRETALFIKTRKARKGPDRRKAMEAVRKRWTSTVPREFTDPKTCSEFYDHSYRDLKEYIGYYLDTSTTGLTSEEVRQEMQRLGATSDLTQKVATVLETCETLRYTPDGVSVNSENARSVAKDMNDILSVKR
jgi:hypothetical protein